MRVTLAYPWTGPDGETHAVGETVDAPYLAGKQLLRDGKARTAPPPTDLDTPPESPGTEGDPS